MNEDELVDLLVDGSREQVVRDLLTLSDTERRVLGPKARRWLSQGTRGSVTVPRAALAVLATAGGVRQAMLVATHVFSWEGDFLDDAVHVLAERDPAWLPDLVRQLLDDATTYNWRLVRGLVRAGAVPPPDHPEYFRGTVFGLDDVVLRDRTPLVDRVRQHPDLVGDHLLGMLAAERAGRALARHDGWREPSKKQQEGPWAQETFAEGTWREALVALQRTGELDRGRLLDAVLAAPLRDWEAVDLGWYVGLHEALAPTLDEVAARQDTYVRLLTVEHGPSVKTAQRELLRLVGDARLEAGPLLDASRATLGRTDKASVTAHLRLLAGLAAERPDLPVADTVRVAGDHPRPDVREQAAKILAGLGVEAAAPEPTPATFLAVEPVPLPPVSAVSSVASADELADVLLGLLEEVEPLEMERAVDGLLRLADVRPATADLLVARASALEPYDDDPRIAARVLALAWLTPRRRRRGEDWSILLGHSYFPADAAAPQTFVGAIGRRLTEVAHAVRQGPHTPVALPTGDDGTLDAATLDRRLRDVSRSRPVLELDLVAALLRVPVAERGSVALPRSVRRSTAVARAQDASPPSWRRSVASYQRVRWEPEWRVPLFHDEHAAEGDAAAGILARSRPEATVGPETGYGEYVPRFEQTLALGATLLPHDHDTLAAHAHPYLHRDLRKERACCAPVLDAIARARSVTGPPSSSALVIGLAAKDARGRTAAQDAILDLARHGLLDGGELGRQAALLLRDDIVVGARITSGLAECVRADDATALPVMEALQALVVVLPGRRDAGAFLQLAADLHERTGRTIVLPQELHELAAGRSSSMAAAAARRLLRA